MTDDRSPFWTFSLTVYGAPGVREQCLALQDGYGIDVNLLLFCTFAGAVHGALMSEPAVEQAAAIVAAWHRDVVKALRQARRALKSFASEAIASPAAVRLRESVKGIELESERIEQIMLQAWSGPLIASWPRAEPRDAIVHNIEMLFVAAAGATGRPGVPDGLVTAALRFAASI